MDKHLRIILELITTGFRIGTNTVRNLWSGLISGITNGAASAASAIVHISAALFFVREAVNTVIGVFRTLWNLLGVEGARSLAQLEARFVALTGSQEDAAKVMEYAGERALRLGKSTEDVAEGLALMTSNARDASGAFDFGKLQELNGLLEQLALLRPDLPITLIARGLNAFLASGDLSSLERIMDMPLRTTEALKDLAKDVEQSQDTISRGVTSLERGAGEAAGDAETRLNALKEALGELAPGTQAAMEALSEVSGMERAQAALEDFQTTLAGPVFEAINDVASAFADMYAQDPEAFREIARSLGEGIGDVIRSLAQVDPEKLRNAFLALAEGLREIDWSKLAQDLRVIAQSISDIVSRTGEIGKFLGREVASEEQTGAVIDTTADILEGLLGGSRSAGSGLRQALAPQQTVKVEIEMNEPMFRARVKGLADQSAAEFGNMVAEEME